MQQCSWRPVGWDRLSRRMLQSLHCDFLQFSLLHPEVFRPERQKATHLFMNPISLSPAWWRLFFWLNMTVTVHQEIPTNFKYLTFWCKVLTLNPYYAERLSVHPPVLWEYTHKPLCTYAWVILWLTTLKSISVFYFRVFFYTVFFTERLTVNFKIPMKIWFYLTKVNFE